MTTQDDRPRIGSAQWWSTQSGVLTAVGTLVAVLGLAFSVITWLKPHPGGDTPGGTPTSATTAPAIAMQRTPSLGIEFWQAKGQDNIAFRNGDPNSDVVDVTLDGTPFEARFPASYATAGVYICAWSDDSIFNITQGADGSDHYCFGFGRGMADSGFGSGTLTLSKDGFNAFAGDRLGRVSDAQDKIYVSGFDTVTDAGSSPVVPIAKQRTPVYLVVWVDADQDHVFDAGEYEYLVLNFA